MVKVFFGLYHTLGDVLSSTSIIRTIKEKYPDSHITYAVGKEYYDVLTYNPDINEIIPCSHPWEVVLRSKDKKYDKVYLPLQLTQEDSLWHQRPPWCVPNGDNHNLVDFYASRCNDDLKVTTRRTYIYPQEKHYQEILAGMPDEFKNIFTNVPYVTIHTTSRNESKDWSPQKFNQLVTKIKEKYGNNLMIYQIGRKDTDKLLDSKYVSHFVDMPILNTAALINNSLVHIDIDSGPSFIADSLDTPVICIMGASTQNVAGPIGLNVTYIEPEVRKCIGTVTHCACVSHCLIKEPCIETISVDTVFNTFVSTLEKQIEKINGQVRAKN